ncbi:cytochrome P450 [Nocardia sp. NPDC048505]|uniref:cytochrome P450 family protein n=1 Tax=Nocardia sp. NPDC048505 TaxID=3155756 RepID=UPI00340CB9A8
MTEPIELGQEFMADPHPKYERLRRSGPVHKVRLRTGLEAWLIIGHAEARELLSDPRLSKDHKRTHEVLAAAGIAGARGASTLVAHMHNTDPPEHTRLRKLVSKVFTPRAVQSWQVRVEEIVDDLLDAMSDEKEIDLVEAFAVPLPVTVICELLGVPFSRRRDFLAWTEALVAGPNTLVAAPDSESTVPAIEAMEQYLTSLVVAKKTEPTADLLSDLVHATDAGDRLTEAELVAMSFLLLVAGHETAVNLVANGIFTLLRHPAQLLRIRRDPELTASAVEEVLRYESPVNISTARLAIDPVRVGEVDIRAGEFVLIALAAANRDPGKFDQPDSFDIDRTDLGHLGFGHGIHFCLGASLARLEAGIAYTRLFDRYPSLRLANPSAPPRWRSDTQMRALASLPVRLS